MYLEVYYIGCTFLLNQSQGSGKIFVLMVNLCLKVLCGLMYFAFFVSVSLYIPDFWALEHYYTPYVCHKNLRKSRAICSVSKFPIFKHLIVFKHVINDSTSRQCTVLITKVYWIKIIHASMK